MRNFWTEKEYIILRENYNNNTIEELLVKLPNRTWEAIKIQASKLGLPRSLSFSRESKIENLLSGSLESFYWIGFILADGHISNNKRLRIVLSILDVDHLNKFADFIKTKIIIREHYDPPTVELTSQNIEVIPTLTQIFDIKSNKTIYPPDFNEYVFTEEQLLALIIGFIDGDGNIQKLVNRNDVNLRIKCHKSWLSNLIFIEDFLYSTFVYDKKVDRLAKINNQGYANLVISNNRLIRELKIFAEDEKLPILARKWNKVT